MAVPQKDDFAISIRLADGRLTAFKMKGAKNKDDYIVPIRLSDGRLAAMKVTPATQKDDDCFPVRLADGRLVLVMVKVGGLYCAQIAFYNWTTEEWEGPYSSYGCHDSCMCIAGTAEGSSTEWVQINDIACFTCAEGGGFPGGSDKVATPNYGSYPYNPRSFYWKWAECTGTGGTDGTLPYDGDTPPDEDIYVWVTFGSTTLTYWYGEPHWSISLFCDTQLYCWPGEDVTWTLIWCMQSEGVMQYGMWATEGGSSKLLTLAEYEAYIASGEDCMLIFESVYPDPGDVSGCT